MLFTLNFSVNKLKKRENRLNKQEEETLVFLNRRKRPLQRSVIHFRLCRNTPVKQVVANVVLILDFVGEQCGTPIKDSINTPDRADSPCVW